MKILLTAKVAKYPSSGAWHFVALSTKDSARIAKRKTAKKASWGFVYVTAKIGKTSWNTSLWPKKEEGVYLLIITAPVRKKEGIYEGDTVRIALDLGSR